MSEMPTQLEDRLYTLDEYFEIERKAVNEKYEYHNGKLVDIRELNAMAGSSVRHSLITMNTGGAIRAALKGGPCRVYDSNLRIVIPHKPKYYYPDVSVICGPVQQDPKDRTGYTATNPTLIVEVLSPSTANFDFQDKFKDYLRLESLRQYVLIAQDAPAVQTYYRQDDGSWQFDFITDLQVVAPLKSLSIDLPLIDVYAGVEFEEPKTG